MANIGPFELIIVLVIALLVLGPKRLPDAGKSLGRGMREFKDALSRHTDDELEPDEPVRGGARQRQGEDIDTAKRDGD